jgi:hypothetical protein
MRMELETLRLVAAELHVDDLDRTVVLCRDLALSHWQYTHAPLADLDDTNQEAVEIISDQNFRTGFEVQFIFQFGLWRLQAIFEGLITQDFLNDAKSSGLTSRLKAMAARGYSLSTDENAELMKWAYLRNELSHRPMTPNSVAQSLAGDDLQEFALLLNAILRGWYDIRRQRSDLPS